MLASQSYYLAEDEKDLNSLSIFLRAIDILKYDIHAEQLALAKIAYPKVNFRYYVEPSVALPIGGLDFNPKRIREAYAIGIEDAQNIVKNGISIEHIMERQKLSLKVEYAY